MKIEMSYKKSTKGTHVYESSKPDTPVPTLYIRKSAFTKDAPPSITVVIEGIE